jgi:hypothetical protein
VAAATVVAVLALCVEDLSGNLPAETGDRVQFVLVFGATDVGASRSNTLRANVKLSGRIAPDQSLYFGLEDVDGGYARALRCQPDARGEISNTEYCHLLAIHSRLLGPDPDRALLTTLSSTMRSAKEPGGPAAAKLSGPARASAGWSAPRARYC